MKKSLLILLAALLPFMGFAAIQVERNPQADEPLGMKAITPAKAPQRIVLGENEFVMGNYTTDDMADQGDGLGLTGFPGTLSIASVVPASVVSSFEGGKVKRIRIAVAAAGVQVNKAFIFKLNASGTVSNDTLACVEVNSKLPYGWNEFTLDEPVEIDATTASRGVAMGFEYVQTSTSVASSYPISVVNKGDIQISYMKGLTGYSGWVDVGLTDYGNLCVQAVVESDNFPEYDLRLSKLMSYGYAMAGGETYFQLDLANFGTANPQSCGIDLYVDEEFVETLQIEQALSMTPVTVGLNVTLPADLTVGKHTLEFVANSIDGIAIENPGANQRVSTPVIVYKEKFQRQKQLVEHLTSNSCTYCPLGEKVLSSLEQIRDDLAWVSIHGNQSQKDPYNTTKASQQLTLLGCSFFPGAVFNRLDFEFQGSLPYSIGYYEQYAAMAAQYFSESALNDDFVPALATVNIDGTLDPNTRELQLTISGDISEGLVDMFDGKVGYTVYITEDSLVAKQLNQGIWEAKYTHNHVMRDRLTSAAAGDALTLVGTTGYENTLTTTLNSAWKIGNLYIVAFVSRTEGGTNLQVFNTEKIAVKDLIKPAVQGDVNGDGIVSGADVTALYNKLLDNIDPAGDADVNGDGVVSGADVTALYNLLLSDE